MTPARTVEVDVQRIAASADIPDDETISGWINRAALAADVDGTYSVSVSLVDDDQSSALNRRYRGKDKPTNVLSFPAGDIEGLPQEVVRPLGDIVICVPVVEKEAAQQGKDLSSHWAHMLVHGALHLLGFDHIEDADAEEMENLEIRVLAGSGISSPYNAGD